MLCLLLDHSISSAHVTTTTAASPPCLDKLDSKEAGDKPSHATEETESFNSFPVPTKTTVPRVRAEELSTVDCLDDEPKSSPPATRHDKVRKPWNFVSHGGNEPKCAEYNRDTTPCFGKDEAFRRPFSLLRVRIEIVADNSNNDL